MGTCIPGFPSVPSAPGMPLEPWKEDLTSKQSLVTDTTASQQLCPPTVAKIPSLMHMASPTYRSSWDSNQPTLAPTALERIEH